MAKLPRKSYIDFMYGSVWMEKDDKERSAQMSSLEVYAGNEEDDNG